MFQILFFSLPILSVIFFVYSLCRYIAAKKKLKADPAAVLYSEMSRIKTQFIIASVIMGAFVAVLIGFTVLMFLAVAYM